MSDMMANPTGPQGPQMQDTSPEDARANQRWRRVVLFSFIGFFCVVVAVNAVFLYVAQTSHSGVVRDRAYETGLEYNRVIEAAEAQDALGWAGGLALEADQLIFTLSDAQGNLLSGATVTARVRRPVVEGQDFALALTEIGAGRYGVGVSWPESGQWDIVVDATWQQTAFQMRSRLVVE